MEGREILKDLLNKKANQNNAIDLNAYAIGLNDGYATLHSELEKAMEWIVKLKGHCEDLLPEFNIPELNDFLNEGKK